jgi:YVTN family beta-propeller protein
MRFAAALLLSCAAFAADPELIVLHKGDSSLGFYTFDGKLQSKVPLEQHPHEIAFSPDGRYLYVTENGTMYIENISAGGNSVGIVDLKARKKAATVSTGTFRRPHGIAYAAGQVWITSEAPDQLMRLDPKSRKIVENIGGVGRITHMVTVTRDGKTAYASNAGSASVSIIDLASKQLKNVETGKRPEGSVLSPDERELYVVNRESAQIVVIDTAKGEVSGTIPTSKGPVRIGVTPDGSTLVYALMHDKKMGFADTKSRKEIATVDLGGAPVSLHLSPDGKRAYAASQDDDTVYIVSVPDRTLIRKFQTPKGYAPDPVTELR